MTHRLGQVFLHDQNILSKIMTVADIKASDSVIEIGCGGGVLTEALVKQAAHVYCIELDGACIQQTKDRLVDYSNIEFIHADVLTVELSKLIPKSSKKVTLVANIPYYISAKIIKWIIKEQIYIKNSVLMVQKEFANKLVAKPGDSDYTSLSVYSNFFLEIKKTFIVSKNCFNPVPKVDSAVLDINSHENPIYDVDQDLFFGIVRSGFWGRRKPLVSALLKSPYINVNKEGLSCPFFEKNPKIRAEMLSVHDFYEVYKSLKNYITCSS